MKGLPMDRDATRLHAETVWLSDTHLGTRGCRAEQLLDFLSRLETRQLFLVGDIVDLQAMRTSPSTDGPPGRRHLG
jgi:hypothetical protein